MPSPSENRAVDIVLAAFPGSEVITPDRTVRIPLPIKETLQDIVKQEQDRVQQKTPSKNKRRGKKPKQEESMF